MQFSVGTDIEQIARFTSSNISLTFKKKVFTNKELDYCLTKENPEKYLSARFSAKEAVIKAFTSFNENLFFDDIEIITNSHKVPEVKILKELKAPYEVSLSLSYSGDYSLAFVVAAKNSV